MKHYGDITKLSGYDLPIVDIVTGGSPCQDLSVAGKRKGLNGERSGLFMEQIRIIKELRQCDKWRNKRTNESIRPRFMVWENVPGAFSSNKGEDFRTVLEETAKVAERDARVPRFEGKWPHSGCVMGDGWSIAWRVHDAQFWGVPQRRKRIALVADFGGQTAPEILFERKGLSGDITESGEEGQGTAKDAERCVGETGRCLNGWDVQSKRVFDKNGVSPTLNSGTFEGMNIVPCVLTHEHQSTVYGISAYDSNAMKSGNPNSGIYEADTSRTLDLNGGSPACNQGGMAVISMATKQLSQSVGDNVAMPICANDYKEPQVVCLEGNGSRPSHRGDGYSESETMYTLNSTEHHAVCAKPIPINTMVGTRTTDESRTTFGVGSPGDPQFTLSSAHSHAVAVENHPADSRVKISKDGKVQTLSSRMGTGGGNVPMVMEAETYQNVTGTLDCGIAKGTGDQLANNDMFVANTSIVRRLTPMECERLQGFPDHWTDIGDWVDSKGKKHKGESDSPRYKALGNSIALPFWEWMAKRMVRLIKNDEPEKEPTMASLFSGIGGFELVFARAGCEPVWCSEIEEFPIAVSKLRFPDNEKEVIKC